MFANKAFRGSGRCDVLWGIVARWLLAMLVGFALGLEFGKAYSHPPRPVALGGDRLAWVEEAAGKLIEVLPAPIDDVSRPTIIGSASTHDQAHADLPLAGAIARLAAGGTADAFARFFPGSARDGPSIQHHQPEPAPGAQRFQRRGGIRAARVSSRLGAGGCSAGGGNRRLAALQLVDSLETRRPLKRGVTVRREWSATRKVGVRWASSAIVVPNAAAA